MRIGDPDVMDNNRMAVERLSARMGLKPRPETPFAVGSRFCGRAEAFAPLTDLSDAEIGFGPELGRVDGTTARAIERLIAAVVARRLSRELRAVKRVARLVRRVGRKLRTLTPTPRASITTGVPLTVVEG